MASESGRGQTKSSNTFGVRTGIIKWNLAEWFGKTNQRMWESCMRKRKHETGIQSTSRHVESAGKTGGPPSKPKYYLMTDSGEYCEGKVKRTPGGEWKRTWNPMFTSTQSTLMCDVVLFVERSGELWYAALVKLFSNEAEGKPSVNSTLSCML